MNKKCEVFNFKNSNPYINNIDINEIAKRWGTPIMIYNKNRLQYVAEWMISTFRKYYSKTDIHYAIKSCYLPEVISSLVECGINVEVVSDFEYKLVKELKVESNKIIINGPGKTAVFLELALKDKTKMIMVESEDELLEINRIASDLNIVAAAGIRINPQFEGKIFVEPGGKLGIDMFSGQVADIIKKSDELNNVKISGIHFHCFSKQNYSKDIISNLNCLVDFIIDMNKQNSFSPEIIDIGGGLDILEEWPEGESDLESLALAISEIFKRMDWKPNLILELGRFLVSDSAFMVSKVIRIKENSGNIWAIVDSSTNTLDPIKANYKIISLKNSENNCLINVGDGTCVSIGTLVKNESLPSNLAKGDLVLIKNVGAYTVNCAKIFAYPIPQVLMVHNNDVKSIFKGVSIDEMLAYYMGSISE